MPILRQLNLPLNLLFYAYLSADLECLGKQKRGTKEQLQGRSFLQKY